MTERWLSIPGYPGYEASDQGRVRSWKGWGGRPRPYVLRPTTGSNGYPQVVLSAPGKQRGWHVHRLVLLTFTGPLPDGMETRHLDGNKDNNALENLCYGTPSENTYDRIRHGTHYAARKTHCSQGHRYDEANTRIVIDGRGVRNRKCITCYGPGKPGDRDLKIKPDANPDECELVTTAEVMLRFGVTRAAVSLWVQKGHLLPVKRARHCMFFAAPDVDAVGKLRKARWRLRDSA